MSIDDARTDEQLLSDYAKKGDRRALELLVKRRHAQAYRFALRCLGDPAAAEDASAEAFVALIRNAKSFDPGKSFGPWWTTILANTVRNASRTRRRQQEREARAAAARPAAVGDATIEGVERAELASHVSELPIDVRLPVILHYYEGRSHAEVAEALGCPKGTAASRIRRGVEQLRDALVANPARAGVTVAALEAALALGDPGPASAAPAAPFVSSLEERAAAARGAKTLAAKVAAAVGVAAIGVLALAKSAGLDESVHVAPGAAGPSPVALGAPLSPENAPIATKMLFARTKPDATPDELEAPRELAPPGDAPVSIPFGKGVPGPAGPSADPVDPDLPAHAATGVRGRVVDAKGSPVAGARVRLTGTRAGATSRQIRITRASPDAPPEITIAGESRSRESSTDDQGRFEVRGLDAGYRYDVVVNPPEEFLAARVPAPALRAESVVDAGTITVKRPARITGVVRGPRGEAVPGARVRLEGPQGPFMILGGEDDDEDPDAKKGPRTGKVVMMSGAAGPGVAKGGLPFESEPLPSTKTDEQGRFTLEKVPPGSHVLAATKRGFSTVRLPGVDLVDGARLENVELRLGEGVGLSILVKDETGAPLAGARVRATGGSSASFAADTDAQGEARLKGLPSRDVEVSIEAEGFVPLTQSIHLAEENGEQRTLVVRRGATLVGRVTCGGKPIPDASCWPEPRVLDRRNGFSLSQRPPTDAEGRFRLGGIAPGEYRIRVFAKGYAGTTKDVSVAGAGEVDVGEIALPALGTLEVSVVDPDGAPVAGADVEASRGGMGEVVVLAKVGTAAKAGSDAKGGAIPGDSRGRTDALGLVRLEGLEPGTLVARASKAGFADGSSEPVVLEPGGFAKARVALPRGARVSGRVLAHDGSPKADARVLLFRKGGMGPAHESASGTDGSFEFQTLPPGEYGVRLADGRGDPEWFTVRDGETQTRTLEAPRGQSVAGVVRTMSGSPVANASVRWGSVDAFFAGEPEVRFPLGKATTDAQGRFAIENADALPRGATAGFSVTSADGKTWTFRAAGTTVELVLPDTAGGTLRASVADDAGPIAAATVTLEREGDGLVVRREVSTDDAGVALFERVPAGKYVVGASAPGRARSTTTLEVGAGEAAARIVLGKGGSLLLEVERAQAGDVFLAIRPAKEPGVPFDAGDVHNAIAAPGKPLRISGLRLGVLYEVTAQGPGIAPGPATTVRCEGDPQTPTLVRVP